MKPCIFLLLFTIIFADGFGSELQTSVDSVRSNYEENLERAVVMCKEHKRPDKTLALSCIPITKREALIFFNVDYKKENQGCFGEILNAMVFYCENKDDKVMKAFMEMSPFVDGYFAEDYFDKMESLYSKHRSFYCNVFSTVDPSKTRRLVGYGLDCSKR